MARIYWKDGDQQENKQNYEKLQGHRMAQTNTVKNVTVIGINPTKVTFKYQINHTGVTE